MATISIPGSRARSIGPGGVPESASEVGAESPMPSRVLGSGTGISSPGRAPSADC
jgi:hypothetical protein